MFYFVEICDDDADDDDDDDYYYYYYYYKTARWLGTNYVRGVNFCTTLHDILLIYRSACISVHRKPDVIKIYVVTVPVHWSVRTSSTSLYWTACAWCLNRVRFAEYHSNCCFIFALWAAGTDSSHAYGVSGYDQRCSPRGRCLGSRPPQGSLSACLALALPRWPSCFGLARPRTFCLGLGSVS